MVNPVWDKNSSFSDLKLVVNKKRNIILDAEALSQNCYGIFNYCLVSKEQLQFNVSSYKWKL